MAIGIYKLGWLNGKYYVGQARNLETRFSEHIGALRSNTHFNYKVQAQFNTFGMPSFIVLKYCSLGELDNEEIANIDLNNKDCLNILPGGSSARGEASPRAIYSNEIIELVFLELIKRSSTHKELEAKFGVDINTINDISSCRGRGSTELEAKYPKEYAKLRDTKSHNTRGGRQVVLTNGIDTVTLKVGEFSEFCRRTGVQNANLSKVIKGERKATMGWSLVSVTYIQ